MKSASDLRCPILSAPSGSFNEYNDSQKMLFFFTPVFLSNIIPAAFPKISTSQILIYSFFFPTSLTEFPRRLPQSMRIGFVAADGISLSLILKDFP